MSKLDKMPNFSSAKSKSPHDMSHDFAFTQACGHLLPVESDILLPGDSIECKFFYNIRNQLPFEKPAGIDFDFHTDYFFVPMELLYKPFASVIYQQRNEWSSNFQDANDLTNKQFVLPVLDMAGIYQSIFLYKNVPSDYNRLPTSEGFQKECIGNSMNRLFDMLGLPCFDDVCVAKSTQPVIPMIFPWQLLAYQCIFQNYFRLEEYEQLRTIFNFDKYYQNAYVSLSASQAFELCSLRCRPLYKDYFTSVKRNPMLNDLNINISSQLLAGVDWTKRFVNSENYINFGGLSQSSGGNILNTTLDLGGITFGDLANVAETDLTETNNSGFVNSVNQLRSLFAMEKLLYVTNRAKKNYDAQTLAHFGIKVPHDVKHEITHIGHEVNTMRIGEVTSLADTSGAALGSYAGKGFCSNAGSKEKPLRFTAPCHGVFMVLFSCIPRVYYDVDFLKKNMVQSPADFYQPEFDNLGMQPIFRMEIEPFYLANGSNPNHQIGNGLNSSFETEVLGWQYRYEEKKRQFNRTSKAFRNGSLLPWMLRVQDPLSNFTNYEVDTTDSVVSKQIRPLRNLYCTPNITDGIFSANYQHAFTSVESLYVTDPFMVNSRVHYKKLSIMSVYSMPKLD